VRLRGHGGHGERREGILATQTPYRKGFPCGPALRPKPLSRGPLEGGGFDDFGAGRMPDGRPATRADAPEVLTMKMSNVDETTAMDDVPVSALLSEKQNRYGSVPGLDDEELASEAELERQVYLQEWGPILGLPVRGKRSAFKPNVDEYFGVDWGAFGTVDFERRSGEFDKQRYKADRLQEELRDLLILLSVVKHRLTKEQFKVLKQLRMGLLDFDMVKDVETIVVGRQYLKALRLQREIRLLRDASWTRRREELAEVLK